MQSKDRGEEEDEGTGGTDPFQPQTITELLSDPFFFAYSEMLLSVHGLLQNLATWAEACPCHEHALHRGGGHAHYAAALSCPCRGKRAPELATGALVSVLRQLSQMRLGALLASLHSRCQALPTSAQVLDKIARDFDKAQLHLLAALQNKSSCWSTLPWLLIGVGHHDPAVSRSAANRCLGAWDELSDDVKSDQHAVSKTLLSEASPLRAQLKIWASGGALDATLLPWVLAWRFPHTEKHRLSHSQRDKRERVRVRDRVRERESQRKSGREKREHRREKREGESKKKKERKRERERETREIERERGRDRKKERKQHVQVRANMRKGD